ncbi:carbon-nitrogen hydrolase family protein [Altererythrobacter aurantiacus]|uniref:Carbon-nitrogen hydrolase family protein n=1 Tax=Parapontixanthobacter aurantiacus TaxID=1463599 RepID=A0A844Z9V2_9SPHN|nr:carbon-nitrogen hydrolase family protein [Parapontixanthobacter aurantiacus]MXO85361.1 carbon-nitrogen hydrolase family protein [Parapontixanthobacter aurantiacus]
MTRIAVLQMQSGIDPIRNAEAIATACDEARSGGAAMLFTPEMSGLLDRDRKRAAASIVSEDEDVCLQRVRQAAAANKLWVAPGSLPILREDGMWANRSYVIDDTGNIAARYDKMHMFDVDLDSGQSWRESNAYRAGDDVVTVETPIGRLGLSICYDIRFPLLFERLGRLSCDVIAIPAAFTKPTGAAHWHVLQRARAIEASAYVVSAAQVGKHEDGRETYGHSLVVDPWGEVQLDLGGEMPSLGFADISKKRIAHVRQQVPSLKNRREIPERTSR